MRIRPAQAADLEVVGDLVQRAYLPYVERIGIRPGPLDDDYAERIDRGCVSVAEDPEIVGLIVLIDEPGHLLIENVAVEPSRQGGGVGRALLSFAEARARQSGTETLRLCTNAAMTENLALYARLGYREDDRRREDGFERVFLSKRL
jgi:ribosomal protein S18 acetylase RimI-like enzyme